MQTISESGQTLSRYDHWIVCESVETAVHKAHVIAGKRDLICVTGSNYTVSEAELIYKTHFIQR